MEKASPSIICTFEFAPINPLPCISSCSGDPTSGGGWRLQPPRSVGRYVGVYRTPLAQCLPHSQAAAGEQVSALLSGCPLPRGCLGRVLLLKH
jgi:hypothetical protein